MGRSGAQPLGLKALALSLLAQREYSRVELRERLLRQARKLDAHATEGAGGGNMDGEGPAGAACASDLPVVRSSDAYRDSSARLQEVDALLDWLQAERHQSDERFIESLVHVQAPRLGTARLRRDATEHGVELSPELVSELKASEFERAQALWARRYGEQATNDRDRARQTRFLVARGFSPEIVRRVLGGHEP